jgi:hypothetical protein
MTSIATVRDRLERAEGLAAVLDAAYAVFEELLAHLSTHEGIGGLVTPFLLAATCAANGRDAVLVAPSLPGRPIHHDQPGGPGGERLENLADVARMVAGLSLLLAGRLSHAATLTAGHADRVACLEAAQHAQEIHDLTARLAP